MRENTVTLDEIKGEEPWTAAEQRLIDEAHTGFVWIAAEVPETATDDNTIRAALIRHVVLGGCANCRVSEKSVKVLGAWVTGRLDFEGCDTRNDLGLYYCHLNQAPFLGDAHLGAVYLSGSQMPGLDAQGLRTDRDLHLRNGFLATGLVDFTGATIGGQMACDTGRFENAKGDALNADAITIAGSLFLRDEFSAKGRVNLIRATIGGQMSCIGGRFENAEGDALSADAITIAADLFLRDGFSAKGRVNLFRADIGGNLQCQNGTFDRGFDGEAMRVKAGFFWHGVEKVSGTIDLTDAHVARLEDDLASWQMAEKLILHGFRYDRTTGEMPVKDRLNWLNLKGEQELNPNFPETGTAKYPIMRRHLFDQTQRSFDPQPYTFLAALIRKQGRPDDATRILFERDKRLHRATFLRRLSEQDGTKPLLSPIMAHVRYGLGFLFGLSIGFGHRPGRILYWVTFILAVNWCVYHMADRQGAMTPTSDVVLNSAEWTQAVPYEDGEPVEQPSPMEQWRNSPAAQDYTTFNAALYAFDLFIPLDALGQEAAWAPSTNRGTWGRIGYWLAPITQVLGWLITAITAAALTGFVGRKD